MLPELASRFGRGLLGEPEEALLGQIFGDGMAPGARLQIYRHHVIFTLTEVLASTFPVVCRLVDRRFFGYAADRYIREQPPAGPCLFEYGELFSDFLATFPACLHLQYLADVARLEWAIHRAVHADDAEILDPARLAEVPPAQIGQIGLVLHPSVSLLVSPFPVDRIWHANQPDADPGAGVSLDAGGVRLEVHRLGEDAVFRPLDAGSHALRAALAGGAPLERALAAARSADPAADVTLVLQQLLSDGIVTAIRAPALACEGPQ